VEAKTSEDRTQNRTGQKIVVPHKYDSKNKLMPSSPLEASQKIPCISWNLKVNAAYTTACQMSIS